MVKYELIAVSVLTQIFRLLLGVISVVPEAFHQSSFVIVERPCAEAVVARSKRRRIVVSFLYIVYFSHQSIAPGTIRAEKMITQKIADNILSIIEVSEDFAGDNFLLNNSPL